MTTEKLDEEKQIEERDDTIGEFIDVVEETKQHQHPRVENAVSGYVEKPEKKDGSIYVTVHVPAYDREVETEVADVDGSLNTSSFLYELLDDFEDIAKLPTQNPIPLKQKECPGIKLEKSHEGEDISESELTLADSNNKEKNTVEINKSAAQLASILLLILAVIFTILSIYFTVQGSILGLFTAVIGYGIAVIGEKF